MGESGNTGGGGTEGGASPTAAGYGGYSAFVPGAHLWSVRVGTGPSTSAKLAVPGVTAVMRGCSEIAAGAVPCDPVGVIGRCLSSVVVPPSCALATTEPSLCSAVETGGPFFAPACSSSRCAAGCLRWCAVVLASLMTLWTVPGVIPSNSLRGVLSRGDEASLSKDPALRRPSTFGSLRGLRSTSSVSAPREATPTFFCFLSCTRSSW